MCCVVSGPSAVSDLVVTSRICGSLGLSWQAGPGRTQRFRLQLWERPQSPDQSGTSVPNKKSMTQLGFTRVCCVITEGCKKSFYRNIECLIKFWKTSYVHETSESSLESVKDEVDVCLCVKFSASPQLMSPSLDFDASWTTGGHNYRNWLCPINKLLKNCSFLFILLLSSSVLRLQVCWRMRRWRAQQHNTHSSTWHQGDYTTLPWWQSPAICRTAGRLRLRQVLTEERREGG